MIIDTLSSLTNAQLFLVSISAFAISHKLGMNKTYYVFFQFLTQVIVDICSDEE